jgi:hypothetical protein
VHHGLEHSLAVHLTPTLSHDPIDGTHPRADSSAVDVPDEDLELARTAAIDDELAIAAAVTPRMAAAHSLGARLTSIT